MSFKNWYYEEGKKETPNNTGESLFESTVGVSIPSLNSFISWLILNKHVKGFIKENKHKKPKSVLDINESKKVSYLVKNIRNIKELALEFSEKFKKE